MAFGKTTKKKQNAAGKLAATETALPVTGSKAKAKQPTKSAALVESTGDSARLKVARTVQMTNVAASSHNPAADQSIIAPVRSMAATAGSHSIETALPVANGIAFNGGIDLHPTMEVYSVAQTAHTRSLQEEISRRAYFYWAERGFQHGFADEDWARAEADLAS